MIIAPAQYASLVGTAKKKSIWASFLCVIFLFAQKNQRIICKSQKNFVPLQAESVQRKRGKQKNDSFGSFFSAFVPSAGVLHVIAYAVQYNLNREKTLCAKQGVS